MKNVLTFLLLLNTYSLAAQTKLIDLDRESFFRFGAKVGVNINKITGQSYQSGFNYNYQVGGFLQFNLSRRFGIQPEINFVQSSSSFTNDVTEIYDDLFREGSQKKSTLNRLEVPLLLNINIGPSRRVKLQAGPSFSTVLKQTVDSLQAGGNIYKNSELGAVAGLWLQLPLVNVGARYKLGLTNINAIDDRQTWKSQAIQVFVGVTF